MAGTGILLSFLFSRVMMVKAISHSAAGCASAHHDSAPWYHFRASFTFTFPHIRLGDQPYMMSQTASLPA